MVNGLLTSGPDNGGMCCHFPRNSNPQRGFTLVQVGVMITILGLVSASLIPGGKDFSVAGQYQTTQARISVIQMAVRNYMATHGALPCPALGYTDIGVTTFGISATSGSTCDSNLLNNGNTFIGAVPVKTLGLSDQIAFDGFGRRFSFAIDGRTSTSAGCQGLQAPGTPGELDIRPSAAGTTEQKVMWLIMSHGFDAHGAYPQNGITNSTYRINTGSSDTDTLTNANAVYNATVGATITASVDAVFVRKTKTNTFDDVVWSDPLYSNRCSLGLGSLTGYLLTPQTTTTAGPVAIGDFNGDGFMDFAYGDWSADYNGADSGSVWIMFSDNANGSIISGTEFNDNGTSPTRIRIDGSGAGSQIGYTLKSGDVNGDGIDDLMFGNRLGTHGVRLLLGRTTWTSDNVTNLTNGTTGFFFTAPSAINFGLGTGDVNGDGLADIIASCYSESFTTSGTTYANAGKIFVIFGRRTAWPSSPMGTVGMTSLLTSPTDQVIYSISTATQQFGYYLTTGDINGDGYADVFAAATKSALTPGVYGDAYIIYGKASPTDVDVNSLTTLTGVKFTSDPNLTFGINSNYSGSGYGPISLALADFNGDGYDEAVIQIPQADDITVPYDTITTTMESIVYVIYGASSYGATSYSLDPASGSTIVNGTTGFYIGGLNNDGQNNLQNNMAGAADLNGDGYKDLFVTNVASTWIMWGRNTATAPISNTNSWINFFTPQNASYISKSGEYIRYMAVGHINHDKYEDVFVNFDGTYLYTIYGRKRSYIPGSTYSGTNIAGILYLDNY